MQWEKRWGNFNWQNVSRHMQSTDHIYRCYQCIFLLYIFIQKQTELHIFYKYIYVLDHFHEKFIVYYTKQQSQRQYQLLLILNLIGATKNKWKLLILIWERHKGNLSSKEKRLKWIISPETGRWRVWKQRTLHIHLHQITGEKWF